MPDNDTTGQGTLNEIPVGVEFIDVTGTAATNTAVTTTSTTTVTATATSTVTFTSELSDGDFPTDTFLTNATRVK